VPVRPSYEESSSEALHALIGVKPGFVLGVNRIRLRRDRVSPGYRL